MSQGGAAFFCGKGINNQDQDASVDGAIAGAHYIKSIAPAYGIPVILHTDHCDKKKLPWLRRMLEVCILSASWSERQLTLASAGRPALLRRSSKAPRAPLQLPHDRSFCRIEKREYRNDLRNLQTSCKNEPIPRDGNRNHWWSRGRSEQ